MSLEPFFREVQFGQMQRLGLTVVACAAVTALATPLIDILELTNIAMIFLLTVLLVSVWLGRRAGILASVLSVLCFDVFFVPPRFSLAVSNVQYVVTFVVMLITALTTTHLTSVLRQRAREAVAREQRTQAMYQLARQLAGTLTVEQVAALATAFVADQLRAASLILVPDEDQHGLSAAAGQAALPVDARLAEVAYASGECVHGDAACGHGLASLYLPLPASMRIRGVLAVSFAADSGEPINEARALLEAVASLVAVALERLHYVEVARTTEVRMLTERLRTSILSALSHDLRTPLTAMVGLADSLFLIKPALPATALETAQALGEQAGRLAGLVANLLDMARLKAGEVILRREWQPLEEVIGAAIKLLGTALAEHPVKVTLDPALPLLQFDAVLIERVLCNLLENAAKHSPSGGIIDVVARPVGSMVEIQVLDRGPGLPAERRDSLFEMFVRGPGEGALPGAGLGLAICRAIVEAHGGQMTAADREGGGAAVGFTLLLGDPPGIEEEVE